ncbi:hypothetical protein AYL99_11434 [Fonsecaea erecta]|uniref:Xylanolytic transcriptional activator regulatory domain-containing protein n=1 Tax=Fonsecaea erecta TaxID=1367422 RepID=A0A178Z574_9EURO|nr:hypothetical protein AYL99_11434 [Fonsecaea erecta]OAP54333.1 hypothetical protein AYL99_11434 [Fonsecaea erecta]
MAAPQKDGRWKGELRACQACRSRKIRPTIAAINALKEENKALKELLKTAAERQVAEPSVETRDSPKAAESLLLLANQPAPFQDALDSPMKTSPPVQQRQDSMPHDDESSEDEEDTPDVFPFLSMDEQGNINSFGPSSALQSKIQCPKSTTSVAAQHIQNGLIAKAALSRQSEHEIWSLSDIDGVPIDLAFHLLELHWNRQHHTFLLTYRPALIRDLIHGGPYCSRFLANAIFACASKFSRRVEVRTDPSNPLTAGARFFERCDQLLHQDSLLTIPRIPTVAGLLLLGSTYIARGETSKGWLYTGYALRMVYDLGLHLDPDLKSEDAEEVEIRRRLFWGAFIYDKLQSLYLGRPIAIHIRDAHVSLELRDTFEEKDLYAPYVDPVSDGSGSNTTFAPPSPVYSVSCFQNFCLLSKIMTRIINKFYVIGAKAKTARASLETIDHHLVRWIEQLPSHLRLRLDKHDKVGSGPSTASPNVLNLHAIYNSLIILLHRPFIADGHLHSPSTSITSWKRCTIAAKAITSIALAYRSSYSLRGAAYLLSYALYVASTIHVRNVATGGNEQGAEHSTLLAWSLLCLRELQTPNCGVTVPVKIIQDIIRTRGISLPSDADLSTPGAPQDHDNLHDLGDFDMDAIFATFPSGTASMQNGGDTGLADSSNVFGQPDILYGFMDGQYLMSEDNSSQWYNDPI